MFPSLDRPAGREALAAQQRAFGEALAGGADSVFLGRFVEAPERAAGRFAAYRRNVLGNWRAALAASYPVVAALLGRPSFEQLAEQYRQRHPSRDGDLADFGAAFPAFLASAPSAPALPPYLADLARLEAALEAAYNAPGEAALDPAKLAAVPPERQGEVVLVLAPCLRAVASPWPLAELWAAHQLAGPARELALGRIALPPRRRTVLASRDAAGRPQVSSVPAGEAAFFIACRTGRPLDQALAAALAADPGFTAETVLPNWLARGWIADVHLPRGEAP